jgi:hypothetical protein
LAKLEQLNDIDPAFSALKSSNKGLMLAEPLCEFRLGEFGVATPLNQKLYQAPVASRVDCFRHELPARRKPAFQLVHQIHYLKIRYMCFDGPQRRVAALGYEAHRARTWGKTMTDATQPRVHPANPTIRCDIPLQETKKVRAGGFTGAFVLLFSCIFVGGIGNMIADPLGTVLAVLMLIAAVYFFFRGIPDFDREASCINCGTIIRVFAGAKVLKCPGCKTRVGLKDDKFQYFELVQKG